MCIYFYYVHTVPCFSRYHIVDSFKDYIMILKVFDKFPNTNIK